MDAAAAIWQRAHERRLGHVPEGATRERARTVLAARLELPDSGFLIAEDAGEVIGMLLASQARESDGAGAPISGLLHISYVAVDPHHWGRGVARALLERIAADAQALEQRHLQLWVVEDNARAIALYERFGFVFSGRRKIYDGEPILHYMKALPVVQRAHDDTPMKVNAMRSSPAPSSKKP